jgi:hypothetical protein
VAQVRAELRAWLRAQWEAVARGGPATLPAAELAMPWEDWDGPARARGF